MINKILYVLVLVSLLVSPAIRTEKRIILPPGAKAGGNYSPGILMDGTLYISGQEVRMRAEKYPGISKLK